MGSSEGGLKVQQKQILSAISYSIYHAATKEQMPNMLSSVQHHLALPILTKCL